MRKRIVIGLLVAVVVGLAAFFVSQPTEGSVEWHKRKCVALRKGPWTERAQDRWEYVVGKNDTYEYVYSSDQIDKHQEALIKLGYLERREFVLSNWSGNIDDAMYQISQRHRADPRWSRLQKWLIGVGTRGTNVLILVATRDDMAVLAEAIRKVDVSDDR